MKKMTKIKRSLKAISPVISVLLMIAIAVAAALVAYAWVTGYMDFTTTKVGKAIQIQSISTTPAVYVQNVGDSKVTLKSCYINDDLDALATANITDYELLKSETAKILEFTNTDAFSEEQITVRIVTTDGTAAEYTETFSNPGSPGATQYSLTRNYVGSGHVSLNATGPYASGTTVELTAVPDAGWSFSEWSEALSGSANPETIVMDSDKTVTATFTQDEYSIGVTVVPSAAGSVSPDIPAPYHYNDVVTLTPTANPGYTFDHWTGDGIDGAGDTRVVTVTDNMAVTAHFTANPPQTLILRPNNDGTIMQLSNSDSGWPNWFDNWECVDDTGSGDGSSTYVYDNSEYGYATDTYSTENHGSASGTINSVTVYINCRKDGNDPDISHARTALRIGSTTYYGDEEDLTSSWTTYSKTYTSNPAGGAWTWTAIDSLQCGVSLDTAEDDWPQTSFAWCTQVYIVVEYTP